VTTIGWFSEPPASTDESACAQALARQSSLTKPAGSLGRLEALAVQLCNLQGRAAPRADRVHICVFAADHGVAGEGVSAYPQSVTAAMVRNFAAGGAAISVLARELGACLEVINLGTIEEMRDVPGVRDSRLGSGTANMVAGPAMTGHQCTQALSAGRQAAERALAAGSELFIGGDMGIGNTTSASAIAAALLGCDPARVVGPGTGLSAEGVARKRDLVASAIGLHGDALRSPADVLRCLGGFEIAALAGSYIACARLGLPVLVDGFISSAAALVASRLCIGCEQWFIFSHTSAEPGHRMILDALGGEPILDLQMRLGEASGAAVAVPLVRLACALHNGMSTFSEAGVANGVDRD
jgi:nicotinate-nucleotide--dimethylbenzimidazole phosphoribosyltransferase